MSRAPEIRGATSLDDLRRQVNSALRRLTGAGEVTKNITNIIGGGGSSTITDSDTVFEIAYGGTITPDRDDGRSQMCFLTGDVTVGAPTNVDGKSMRLVLVQDGTGGHAVTFNAAWEKPADVAVPGMPGSKIIVEAAWDGSGVLLYSCWFTSF